MKSFFFEQKKVHKLRPMNQNENEKKLPKNREDSRMFSGEIPLQ